jgi:putative sigma-54 modulation protein
MTIKYVGNFTTAMKDYVEEKISKISKKGIECESVRVKLDILPNDKHLEISINNKIRNSKKGDDFYALVVDVVDSICSQVSRYKKYNHHKNRVVEEFANVEFEPDDNMKIGEISRNKIVILESLSVDEAIENMEILGHSFFVYRDIDCKDNICLVYKRKDETYGRIECR